MCQAVCELIIVNIISQCRRSFVPSQKMTKMCFLMNEICLFCTELALFQVREAKYILFLQFRRNNNPFVPLAQPSNVLSELEDAASLEASSFLVKPIFSRNFLSTILIELSQKTV